MSSKSTDPVVAVDTPIKTTGRTGWDILFGSRYFILIVVAILGIILLLSLSATAQQTSDFIAEYGGYLVPFALGLIFGYWVYYHFIWEYVILQIEDKTHNIQTEFHISRILCRELIIKSGGAINPTTTGDGRELWRLKYYNRETNEIIVGDCHDPNVEFGIVMVYREKYDALILHDKEMTIKAVCLQKLPHILGMKFSKTIVKDVLEAMGIPDSYSLEDDLGTRSENDIKDGIKVKEGKIDVDDIADPKLS